MILRLRGRLSALVDRHFRTADESRLFDFRVREAAAHEPPRGISRNSRQRKLKARKAI